MPPGPSSVLYVEDEESDRLLMQRAFMSAGMGETLRMVEDGQAAVDYLSGTGKYAERTQYPLPALVLLDLNLPELSGFEVLKWTRSLPHLQGLPIVVFSSSSLPEDRAKSMALGANDYLEKPRSGLMFRTVARELKERWLSC
ncbi:MAG TPA: response regulator [Verrucomicrobiae bacterium]